MLKRKPGIWAALWEGSLRSQFITHQYFRLLKDIKTGDVNCCAKLRGHQFSRRRRETAVGYRLCNEGNRMRWMSMMLKVQELINLSTSPSFASGMGYCHHHIGLNSFSWHSVSFKAVPCSKQGWYGTGADYLQGLNFNLSNQSPNPAHAVYVKNHMEPNTAGFIATIIWGNVVQLHGQLRPSVL